MIANVTTWHLEMRTATQLRQPRRAAPELTVQQVEIPTPALNRFFYTEVGRAWHWTDRLSWTTTQWEHWVNRPEVQTHAAWTRGSPVGYFELESQPGPAVELVYFGLLEGHIGRGYGAVLLAEAVRRAWAMKPQRVWVHTCSLDHPNARASYEARGFRLFKEEVCAQQLGDRPGAAG